MQTRWLRGRLTQECGFSLLDQIATLAIVATMAGIAVPALKNSVENRRLSIESRNVERELQLARLSAVSTNRPIRIRFNCPAAGSYRRVELIGSVNAPISGHDADNVGDTRCNATTYPFPASDKDPLTRPNNDGPIQKLHSSVTFGSVQTLEFWPNGTVHVMTGATPSTWLPLMGTTPVTLTLVKGSSTKSITVNNLGKVQIQ
jgi:type II secretory pathway pseudopilin PulG